MDFHSEGLPHEIQFQLHLLKDVVYVSQTGHALAERLKFQQNQKQIHPSACSLKVVQ